MNTDNSKRATFPVGKTYEVLNICDKPRQHNHRNEYALQDEQCKQYDHDMKVIEYGNQL